MQGAVFVAERVAVRGSSAPNGSSSARSAPCAAPRYADALALAAG